MNTVNEMSDEMNKYKEGYSMIMQFEATLSPLM